MRWSDVRGQYPDQWVLVEAIDAITKDNKRILEQLSVVESFQDDSKKALKKYIELHRQNKERELYVIHTSREVLDIEEVIWTGIRAAR